MSVTGGLFAGVASIGAQATAFGIISDNIANSQTVGYKETQARFQTLVTRSPTATAFTPGGVQTKPITDPSRQGLLQATSSTTDMAVDGNGFFVVNEAPEPGSDDEYFLTRAGAFNTDENGRLVNTAGYYLQGWRTDATGAINNQDTRDLLSSLETVDLSQFGQIANATDDVTINANLPAGSATGTTVITNITIYDSLGFDYLLETTWTKAAAANTWTYDYTLIRNPGTVNATSMSLGGAARTMTFNTDGSLRSVNGTTAGTTNQSATETLTITRAEFSRSVATATITIDWGTYGQPTGMSQFNGNFETSLLNQDGSGPSALIGVSISEDGLVAANFANGQSRNIYRLPIGTVPSSTELETVNGNAYRVTSTSGDIVLSIPTNGGTGRIQSGALENSTTDIATEFTDLIITQRAYSASTRIITTGDELLDEIIRIKR
ncbi:MAG: flagellar hook protein FlgE [Nisaea sp.]|uniref:flagellar hook protein FlgE n=1 Tax=Nisaea sp. TaxID=2024842 RepID=UPI001B1385CB|nr:flagellar hook protein FlgE [Nisaea sp.]MBO6560001.1 flagellar hook protein FlgE [Nisaea sp.]